MKEFDFDELDRAVASLMDKAAPDANKNEAQQSDTRPVEEAKAPDSQASEASTQSIGVSDTSTDDTAVKVFTPAPEAAPAPQEEESQVSLDEPKHEAVEDGETDTSRDESDTARTSPTPAHSVHQTVQFQPSKRSYARPSTDETEATPDDVSDTTQESQGIEEPQDNKTEEVEEATPAPKPKRIVPHRTGRFMDMKPAGSSRPTTSSSNSLSRHGVTIEPHSDSAPVLDVVKPTTSEVAEPEVSEVFTPDNTSDFPDPIDVHTNGSATTGEADHEFDAPVKPASSTTLGKADYSAFLTDAKPEKRPLGGAVPGADDQKSEDTAPTEIPTSPDISNEPAHEEFDRKLMAIESGDIEKALPDGKEHTTPTSEAKPSVTPQEKKDDAQKSVKQDGAPAPKAIESTPIRPTGPTSIPRQYEEQPSSGPDNNGAIFDTATYHQPLEHPAKKSHGWLWVLLIVIVIALGAGIGAVLYLGYL